MEQACVLFSAKLEIFFETSAMYFEKIITMQQKCSKMRVYYHSRNRQLASSGEFAIFVALHNGKMKMVLDGKQTCDNDSRSACEAASDGMEMT